MTFNDLLRRLFGSPEEAIQRRIGEDPSKLGLSWRVNIVDLLRVLDLDTSRDSRDELARDLGLPEGDDKKLVTAVHDRLRAFGEG
jgi:hypothetical protein